MSLPSAALPDFDQWWDYEHPAETEAKFRTLLADPITNDSLPYRIELLTQIARTEGLQRRFAEAHATLDTALRLLPDGVNRANVRYLLERGRVFNSSRHLDKALPLFEEAWESARAIAEDGLAVDAAHMVAIVADKEAQMEWNIKALTLAEHSDDPQAQKWLGSLYNNIGWTLHGSGGYAEALEIFEKAAAFRERQGNSEALRIARWCVARTLRSLGRIEAALAAQHALQVLGQPTPYVHEEIGECLLLLGRPEEARPYFTIAYEILSQDAWFAENHPERLQRLRDFAQPIDHN